MSNSLLIKNFFHNLLVSIGLSIYAFSSIYQANIYKISFLQSIHSLFFVVINATFLFFFFKLISLGRIKISNLNLIVPISTIYLFQYKTFYIFYAETFNGQVIRNLYLLIFFFLFLIFLIFIVSKIKNRYIIRSLFTFLIILNLIPCLGIALKLVANKKPIFYSNNSHIIKNTESEPDIYYLIFDMYPSEKVLNKFWKFDNSNFLFGLKNLGFKIFSESQSNYPRTYLALNSILNLNYIHKKNETKQDFLTESFLNNTIMYNKASIFLKERGYNYYIFEGGIIPKVEKKTKQDFFLSDMSTPSQLDSYSTSDNDFFLFLINNSVYLPFADKIQFISSKIYRKRINYVFNKLPELSLQNDKKFVIAHVLSPHSPYIFDQNGKDVFISNDSPLRKLAFLNQLKFINQRIFLMITKLINDSRKRKKIIIIQGDHGTREIKPNGNYNMNQDWAQEFYGNFNAIYSDDPKFIEKYKYSSPVNTFRQLFNIQFNQKLALLEDKIYFTDFNFPLFIYEMKK